jgi:uncharacterized protein
VNVLVMAKEPVPGRVKTRLCPPCSPVEAAALAAAALEDTLCAALSSGADRVVLALEGGRGAWCPPGVEVIEQGTGSLDHRLAHAWQRVGGPGVQIGMDTPQVTGSDLDGAMATLMNADRDATLGLAADGGWWLIGLRRSDERVFLGVPMSRPDTGQRQQARLRELGLRCGTEPVRRDVDRFDDAVEVAGDAPTTRFAACFRSLIADGRPAVGVGS